MDESFDRSQLIIKPLSQRDHDLKIDHQLSLSDPLPDLAESELSKIHQLGLRLQSAKKNKAARLILMGAHVIRASVALHLIEMMEQGLISHIGINGAGPIHDYELARIGATCESVARYIKKGEFGHWQETGELNDLAVQGIETGLGLGRAIGQAIFNSDYPYKKYSLFAAAYRLNIPITVHIGLGYDILHQHPNFNPAVFAVGSYRDFLQVCKTVSQLEGGVFLNFGSAVMGPEVYLKALSMARNVAQQQGKQIAKFTTAAFDLLPLVGDTSEEPKRTDPQYFYRPWKTILARTVADGGESFYVCGNHRATIPHLRKAALSHAQAETE